MRPRIIVRPLIILCGRLLYCAAAYYIVRPLIILYAAYYIMRRLLYCTEKFPLEVENKKNSLLRKNTFLLGQK